MTAPVNHDHAHGAATHDHGPFTSQEIQNFHGQDIAAAKAVVVEMVGIFLIGVVIYTIVNIACMM